MSDILPVGAVVSGVAQAHRQHRAASGNAARQKLRMKSLSGKSEVPGPTAPAAQTAELLVSNMAAGNALDALSRKSR
jgi:hypothetical protein